MGTWQARAACRGTDPNIFHPDDAATPTEALAICATCPVREECLMWALATNQRHGVFGGKTASQLRRLHAQRGRVVA